MASSNNSSNIRSHGRPEGSEKSAGFQDAASPTFEATLHSTRIGWERSSSTNKRLLNIVTKHRRYVTVSWAESRHLCVMSGRGTRRCHPTCRQTDLISSDFDCDNHGLSKEREHRTGEHIDALSVVELPVWRSWGTDRVEK